MADVDPFIQPIPRKFQQDPELRSYFEYLHKHLFQQWVRTGAGDDAVANAATRESFAWRGATQRARKKHFAISADHTTAGNEYLQADAGLTVYLNSAPSDMETVTAINNSSDVVTIDGNGKNISGESVYQMLANGEVRELTYLDGEWF